MGSGAVIYVPGFINIDSSIRKLIDLISLIYFFKIRKVQYKR
jgi:hypothetical protein